MTIHRRVLIQASALSLGVMGFLAHGAPLDCNTAEELTKAISINMREAHNADDRITARAHSTTFWSIYELVKHCPTVAERAKRLSDERYGKDVNFKGMHCATMPISLSRPPSGLSNRAEVSSFEAKIGSKGGGSVGAVRGNAPSNLQAPGLVAPPQKRLSD